MHQVLTLEEHGGVRRCEEALVTDGARVRTSVMAARGRGRGRVQEGREALRHSLHGSTWASIRRRRGKRVCGDARENLWDRGDAPVRLEVVLDALVVAHRHRHARAARKAMEEVDFETLTCG